MKRWLSMVLAMVMLFGLVSCAPNDTASGSSNITSSKDKVSSGLVASGDGSSDESATSSGLLSELISSTLPSSNGSDTSSNNPASSNTISSRPNTSSNSGTSSSTTADFFDVDAEVARRGLNKNQDVSVCFKEGEKGYIVNGGPYKVDEATLVRLTKSEVKGNGSVKWAKFSKMGASTGNTDLFDGIVPVSKLHDPIFMSTALPSELQTYMDWRINATNMALPISEYKKAISIGAVYKAKGAVIPDDAEITLCLGKIMLVAYTEERGWFMADQMTYPTNPMFFYLPWEVGSAKIPSSIRSNKTDHVEIKLTGAMLNGNYGKENFSQEVQDKIDECVVHYWGNNWIGNVIDIKGVVAGHYAWIKEEEYVGKVVAAVGVDYKRPDGSGLQAFSGRNYKLTTEPRLIFGHNVGPKAYDEIMDTEKVQQLLGLK